MRHLAYLLFTSFLLLSCSNVNIAQYSSYPAVTTVAKKLDSDFKILGSNSVYFTLAKKPKGWFVVRMNSKTLKPVDEKLFWSVSRKSYERISPDFFKSTESTGEVRKVSNEIRYNLYNFDHSIFFGYEGWENDVIAVLGNAKNLNDTLLESLARAYGSLCLNLTRFEKDPVAKRSGKISDLQVEEFCKYGNKDLETYKQLLEMNPEYETIVGKVKTKLSNEYLFLWSELKQSGREKEAAQFLPDGLYDDMMINFAKNMLNAAEKDGIIFTNGDNDTYPLWYVQQKLGVRKDLAIMNTSLMNIPGWIFAGRNNYNFNLGLSEKFYNDSLSDVIYLANATTNVFGMGTLKEGMENRDPSFFIKSSIGEEIIQLPFGNIRLSYMNNDSLAPVIEIKGNYLYKNELAIFDIIASNIGKRTIYFAQTAIAGTVTDALARNLLTEGMLVRVVQGENKGTFSQDKYFDLALCYQHLVVDYNYGLSTAQSFQVVPIAVNYIYNFHGLSSAFLEQGDTLKAAQVAEACVAKIPFSKFTEPVGPYLIGDDLCRSGKIKDGQQLLKTSYDRIKVLLPKETDEFELERNSSILNLIAADADKFGFSELTQPCIELKKEVDEKISKLAARENR